MNVERKWVVLQDNQRNGKVYYLRCSTYTSFARLNLCTSHSIREDFVEKQVIQKLTEICNKFVNKDNLIAVTKTKIEEKAKSVSYLKETENLKKYLEKLTFEIDSIYSDKLNGILSEDDFKRIYERKKLEKKTILEKIKKIKNYVKNNIIDEDEMSREIVQKFLDIIQNATTSNITKEILTDLVDKVEIDNNKNIYIYFKFKRFENLQ